MGNGNSGEVEWFQFRGVKLLLISSFQNFFKAFFSDLEGFNNCKRLWYAIDMIINSFPEISNRYLLYLRF